MTHNSAGRPKLSRTVAFAGFDECHRALVDLPEFLASPLSVRIERLAKEYRRNGPNVALHARRLKEAEDYIEKTTGRSLGETRRVIDEFVDHLTGLHIVRPIGSLIDVAWGSTARWRC